MNLMEYRALFTACLHVVNILNLSGYNDFKQLFTNDEYHQLNMDETKKYIDKNWDDMSQFTKVNSQNNCEYLDQTIERLFFDTFGMRYEPHNLSFYKGIFVYVDGKFTLPRKDQPQPKILSLTILRKSVVS